MRRQGVVILVEAKKKSSLKDIAAAISSDEDDYNDDKFEGNDTGIAKPSKPSRPSGTASRPVGGARPTAKKPSTASRPQGRPKEDRQVQVDQLDLLEIPDGKLKKEKQLYFTMMAILYRKYAVAAIIGCNAQ